MFGRKRRYLASLSYPGLLDLTLKCHGQQQKKIKKSILLHTQIYLYLNFSCGIGDNDSKVEIKKQLHVQLLGFIVNYPVSCC